MAGMADRMVVWQTEENGRLSQPIVVLPRVLKHLVHLSQPIVVMPCVLEHLVCLSQPIVVLPRVLEHLVLRV